MSESYKDEKWLREKYYEEDLTQKDISEICGVASRTIGRWLKKFDLKRTKHRYKDEEWLHKKYIEEDLTQSEIAEICDVSSTTIGNWCHKFDFETGYGGSVSVNCNWCGSEFQKQKRRYEIDERHFCDGECYGNWRSENLRGENNPSWVEGGGRDREIYTEQEREEIFERDDYTCQDCGQKGGQIQAHHLIRVSEDKNKSHDIDNGVTLCTDCHIERHEEADEIGSANLLRRLKN